MRRILLIFISLVLTMVGWGMVNAADNFYVIPTMRGKYAPVPKTGQTTVYGTGDDGAWQKGVAWPTPRFTDNNNGTVTDNLTRLIWMKDAGVLGTKNLAAALTTANGLAHGSGGLTDGSQAGDWRLPNVQELQSLIDYGRSAPALPAGHQFTGVTWQNRYWSSTSENGSLPNLAWWVGFDLGFAGTDAKSSNYLLWCVRGGP